MNTNPSEKIIIGKENYELLHFTSNSPELNEDFTHQFSKTFREIFSNPPYGQYLVYPSIGIPISPQEVFNTDESYVDIKKLDAYDTKSYSRHPTTTEEAIFWQEPKRTFQIFQKKFKKDAFLTLLRKPNNPQIWGSSFGYEASLQKAFKNEEWKNPLHYSIHKDYKQLRQLGQFIRRIQETTKNRDDIENITEETRVFCLNCIFVRPEIQNNKAGLIIMASFLKQLPPSLNSLLCICEMIVGTNIYETVEKNGAIPVPGILSKDKTLTPGKGVIMVSTLEKYRNIISQLLTSKKNHD